MLGLFSNRKKLSVPVNRRFYLVLVKPSHYDDDGYVDRKRTQLSIDDFGPVD
jgi:hypothetical protein